MKSSKELLDLVNYHITQLDNLSPTMKLVKGPANLYEPIIYAMNQGGKRIRPTLLLLTNQAYGGNLDDAMYPAMGIELFHNFTLLHDDIMDRAVLRRGNPTVYHKWNSNIAILSGDAMCALAIKYIFKTKSEFMRVLTDTFIVMSIKVYEGQQYDADFENIDDVPINDYLNMIYLKTAVLIGAAMKIGAIIACKNEAEQNRIYEYGCNVGMAFQLMDDLLDVYADEKTFGKKPGGDILCCKKTYVYLKALEVADSATRKELKTVYCSTDMNPDDKIRKVTALFDKLDVKAYTYNLVDDYYAKADKIMKDIDISSENKKQLVEYCNKLARRNY